MSGEGSINEPGWSHQSFTPQSINEPIQLPDIPTPVISVLDPSSCTIGDADFTLAVSGENFFAGSIIFFAGHDEPTTYDETAGTVSTGVKPSLWGTPVVVQCQVHNGDQMSNALDFTFGEAGETVTAKRKDEFTPTHR